MAEARMAGRDDDAFLATRRAGAQGRAGDCGLSPRAGPGLLNRLPTGTTRADEPGRDRPVLRRVLRPGHHVRRETGSGPGHRLDALGPERFGPVHGDPRIARLPVAAGGGIGRVGPGAPPGSRAMRGCRSRGRWARPAAAPRSGSPSDASPAAACSEARPWC